MSAIGRLRPPVHLKTKPLFTAAVGRIPEMNALQFWQKLIHMEQELKSGHIPEPYTHLGQGLLGICLRLKPRR